MFKHKRWAILIALIVSVALVLAACGEKDDEAQDGLDELPITSDIQFNELDLTGLDADTVIATYDGGEIRGDEFASYIAFHGFINPSNPVNDPEFRRELVDFLVLQKLFEGQVADTTYADEQVDNVWNQYEMYIDAEVLEQGYQKLHTSPEEIRANLRSYFLTQSYFRELVGEDNARAYYEGIKHELEYASVRHILIGIEEINPDGSRTEVRTFDEAKEFADGLYAELQAGADFAELAREHSTDPGSAENGGLYQYAPINRWVPEFRQAVLDQEIGEIGQPVKTDFGYHIILVEERGQLEFEEIKDDILDDLANQEVYEYMGGPLQDKITSVNI